MIPLRSPKRHTMLRTIVAIVFVLGAFFGGTCAGTIVLVLR